MVDTYAHWTLLGKIIILVLIQIGGMGVISITGILLMLAGKRITLSNQILIRDTYGLDSLSGVNRFLKRVILGTLIVEGIGAICYSLVFIPELGVAKGIANSIFTAVSAFCNAGIDVLGPDSLTRYSSNYWIMFVTMALIILGGIGYVVWFDVVDEIKLIPQRFKYMVIRRKGLNEHSRIVVYMTLFLIFGGALIIYMLEQDNPQTIGNMTVPDKIWNSIFQSVTYRTAGFTTISQAGLTEPTTVVGDILMFIGGSPIGTAGGIKTVTFLIVLLNVKSFVTNKTDTVICNRRLETGLIRKAMAITTVHFSMMLVLSIFLCVFTGFGFSDCVYETMSGISTVGVSRGITASLNSPGQMVVIIAMFLGRIGPISMALFFHTDGSIDPGKVRKGVGRFFVG